MLLTIGVDEFQLSNVQPVDRQGVHFSEIRPGHNVEALVRISALRTKPEYFSSPQTMSIRQISVDSNLYSITGKVSRVEIDRAKQITEALIESEVPIIFSMKGEFPNLLNKWMKVEALIIGDVSSTKSKIEKTIVGKVKRVIPPVANNYKLVMDVAPNLQPHFRLKFQ